MPPDTDAERLMILEDSQNLQPSGWSPEGALLFEYRTTAGTSVSARSWHRVTESAGSGASSAGAGPTG